jgi:hypothetical protein
MATRLWGKESDTDLMHIMMLRDLCSGGDLENNNNKKR